MRVKRGRDNRRLGWIGKGLRVVAYFVGGRGGNMLDIEPNDTNFLISQNRAWIPSWNAD
jgi:hypothetical protein